MFRSDLFVFFIFIIWGNHLKKTGVFGKKMKTPDELEIYGHDDSMKSETDTEPEAVMEFERVLFRLENITKNSPSYQKCADNNIIGVNNDTRKEIIISTLPTFKAASCVHAALGWWQSDSSKLTINVLNRRYAGKWQCRFITTGGLYHCYFKVETTRTKQLEILVTSDNGSNVYHYKTGDKMYFRCVGFGDDLVPKLNINGSYRYIYKVNDRTILAIELTHFDSPFMKVSCEYKNSERMYRVERILHRIEVPIKNETSKAPKEVTEYTEIYSQNRSESERSDLAPVDSSNTYSTWIYIIVPSLLCIFVLSCVVIAYWVFRGSITKRKYIKHTSTNVVYEKRTPSASETSETSVTKRQNRVSRDSATYVTMTPGETPSVVHYLLPTRVNRAEILMKKLAQDNLLGYVTMNPTSDNTSHNSSEQNMVEVNHGYLTMKPASDAATSNASDVKLESSTPSFDVTVNEIIYEECYAGRLNIFGAEKQ